MSNQIDPVESIELAGYSMGNVTSVRRRQAMNTHKLKITLQIVLIILCLIGAIYTLVLGTYGLFKGSDNKTIDLNTFHKSLEIIQNGIIKIQALSSDDEEEDIAIAHAISCTRQRQGTQKVKIASTSESSAGDFRTRSMLDSTPSPQNISIQTNAPQETFAGNSSLDEQTGRWDSNMTTGL